MAFTAEFLESFITSPWIYLVILLVVGVDAFFPLVPGEMVVIAAGAFAAATGSPSIALVVAVTTIGAVAGDNIAYAIGHRAGPTVTTRLLKGRRGTATQAWARRALRERGGTLIVVSRFVPGGRTATTVTAGTLRYPCQRFQVFTGLAALSWACYVSLLGYWGGVVFGDDPVRGLLVGAGVAVALTALVEAGRNLSARWSQRTRTDTNVEPTAVPGDTDRHRR